VTALELSCDIDPTPCSCTVFQDARMGRATGTRTKNVFGNWEIEVYDAILKEAQLILAEHPRDDETKGGE
jgi:hypothetical protein